MIRGRYREEVESFTGTTSTVAVMVAPKRPLRRWCYVECDLTTGVPLTLQWGKGSTSSTWGIMRLQPGESVTFDCVSGSMAWYGAIYVTGHGGTTGYRGGDTYLERY